MNAATRNSPARLTVTELRRIDTVCVAFETAWRGGECPALESFCTDTAGPARAALLRELLLLEVDYRQRAGEIVERSDYADRLPADADVVRDVFDFLATQRPASGLARAGQVVGGYELLEELGRGGMGVVFKARQIGLNRLVALKMVLAGPHAAAEQVARFRREAATAANLQHAGIVAIHEIGEHEGLPFFCMDYVEGKSLRDLIRDKSLPARRAAEYVLAAAEAIHYAHQEGTLHRDLKPANVLIDRNGQVRVTDFGLAKCVRSGEELTGSGQVLGTPGYMAPEQAAGKLAEVGPLSDVYSLGAILYELTTGRPPFHGESPTDTILQVLRLEPVSPRLLNPKVPRDLETICLKCLQKEPARRYASAALLSHDLARFLRGEPIRARPVGRVERLWRACRRQPLAASLAAALAVALLAGIAVSSCLALLADARARQATDQLWHAYLAQAQAGRRSGIPGQRFESLHALAAAAAIRPSAELRDEAITCLGLADLTVQQQWPCACVGDPAVHFSAQLDCYAAHDSEHKFWIWWRDGRHPPLLLPGPYRRHEDFLFSPRGCWLAEKSVQDATATCRVWNVARRAATLSVPADVEIGGLAFTPDGRTVIVAGPDRALHFFRVEGGDAIRSWACHPLPTNLVCHPAGRRLAAFRVLDSTLRILDVETGLLVRVLRHPAGLWSVAWHPHGAQLAAACGDSYVYIWNVQNGRLENTLRGHQADVVNVLYHPAGDVLATSSWDGTTRLWDATTGRPLLATHGELRRISEDGQCVAFWRYDVMGVWQLARPDYRTYREITGSYKGPWGASFGCDGRFLASASDDGVRLWDLDADDEREIAFLPLGHTMSVQCTPDGQQLLTAGVSGVQQWPLQMQPQTDTLIVGPPTTLIPPQPLPCARLTLDRAGRQAAVAIRPDQVALLDLTRPSTPTMLSDQRGVEYLSLSPDGAWLASGGFHGMRGVSIWNLQTMEVVQTLVPKSRMARVLFSPDGKWLLTSTEREYQLWDTVTWSPQWQLARDDQGLFGPMAFSPDARLLAYACSRYAIQLVDVATRTKVARLEPPTPQHLSWLCFSPDGTRLAATSESHTMQLWDLRIIRESLARMRLDWDRPPFAPRTPRSSVPIESVKLVATVQDRQDGDR
jgi:WD40 repeat protein/predicted Ser/Thr protein kinase